MFQPKLRSLIASTLLLSALTLLPDRALGAGPRQPAQRKGRPTAESRAAGSPWSLLVQWLSKAGVTIDPEGVQDKPPLEEGAGAQLTGARLVPTGAK